MESKAGRKVWRDEEECFLIQSVMEREGRLFGAIKGSSGGGGANRQRCQAWKDITDLLNLRYMSSKRSTDEVKKKYFNLKQRAKDKIDAQRRACRQTGGGPAPPSLSIAEECLSVCLGDRPGIHGVPGAVDSDDITPVTVGTVNKENSTQQTKDATPITIGKTTAKFKVNKKRNISTREKLEEATLANTIADTKRIRLSQAKIRSETIALKKWTEVLNLQMKMLESKKQYYDCKLLTEFGLIISDPSTQEGLN